MDPEHVALIGGALWVFLFLLQRADERGQVFQGEAVPLELVAGRLGISERSARRHLARLREAGYIEALKGGQGGLVILVNGEPGQEEPAAKSGRTVESLRPNLAGCPGPAANSGRTGVDHAANSGRTPKTLRPILAAWYALAANSGRAIPPPPWTPLRGTKELILDLLLRPPTTPVRLLDINGRPAGYLIPVKSYSVGAPESPRVNAVKAPLSPGADAVKAPARAADGCTFRESMPVSPLPDQIPENRKDKEQVRAVPQAAAAGAGREADGLRFGHTGSRGDGLAGAKGRVMKVLQRIDAAERPDLTRRLIDALGPLDGHWLGVAVDACWDAWRKRGGRLNDPPAWWAAMLEKKGRLALTMQQQEQQDGQLAE